MNYDVRNWQMLIDQLLTDHEKIDVVNRAQIVDDALNLARSGDFFAAQRATRQYRMCSINTIKPCTVHTIEIPLERERPVTN